MRYFIYVQFGEQKSPFIHVVEVSHSDFFEYIDFISNYFKITKDVEFDDLHGYDVIHYYYGHSSDSAIASAGYIVVGGKNEL